MPKSGESLSKRELDVLACVVKGSSNREIASTLHISPHTVKVHLRNIYTKLAVSSRTEATALALQEGLLTPTPPPPEEDQEGAAPTPTPPPPEEDQEGAAPTPNSPSPEEDQVRAAAASNFPASGGNEGGTPWRLWGLIIIFSLLGINLLRNRLPEIRLSVTATPTPFQEEQIEDSRWFQSQPIPEATSHMGLVTIGLNLYQIGGETAGGITDAVYIFDLATGEWQMAMGKITAVMGAKAAVISGEIYLPGGQQQNGDITSIVEVYSPANNAWRPTANLPEPRAYGLTLAHNGFLYYLGGQSNDDYHAELFRYDPSRTRWETLPSMPTPRTLATGHFIADQLIVVGGQNKTGRLATCERFDLVSQRWTTCTPLPQPIIGADSVVLLNKLYLLGGGQSVAGWRFTPLGEVWEELEAPPSESSLSSHLGITTIENRIHLIGGTVDDGDLQTRVTTHLVYAPFVYQFFIPAAP